MCLPWYLDNVSEILSAPCYGAGQDALDPKINGTCTPTSAGSAATISPSTNGPNPLTLAGLIVGPVGVGRVTFNCSTDNDRRHAA